MRLISIVNHKGGVGKSTLCLNLAHCYASGGLQVCIADSDVQGSITILTKMVNASVKVVPYTSLENAENDAYDVVLIDTPPYHTSLTDDIISRSDFVLVPLKPSYFDVLAMKSTVDLICQIQRNNSRVKGGIVLNMIKQRSSITNEMRSILDDYPLPLLDTLITERVSYVRSSLSTNGVFDSDDQKAKDEMISLASEMLERMTTTA